MGLFVLRKCALRLQGMLARCIGPNAVWLLQAWDEFKPYKKENKHTKARERVRASAFSMDSEESMDGPLSAGQGSQLISFLVGCSLPC